MMKYSIAALCMTFFISNLFGQMENPIVLETETGNIEGTLLIPDIDEEMPIALIIAGSGPTDRDGNNIQMKNNSLKMLALGLAENNIASLRYDKRGVGKSFAAGMKEIDLRFEYYVDDATKWIDLLDNDNRFSEIIVIGHSEGSLIGMIASQKNNVAKFISLAGVAEPAGVIIRQQLAAHPPMVLEQSIPIIESLERGETVDSVPAILVSLFRKSVQPYIISWFKHNPSVEIEKLQKPILIVQGTTDIQVGVEEATKLSAANPGARKVIIEGMNHILKEAVLERIRNIETYSNPDLPLHPALINSIVDFIKDKR